jgi:hypothetical protein
MDFIKRIVLIRHKPQPPTLILANHVPIAMHMGMMPITTSHFTQDYNMASHRTPTLVKRKKERCDKQGVGHQTNSRPTQHHGN